MKKILVIEDEKYLLDNIKTVLSKNNFNVYTAENGKDGYEVAQRILPDLILCDIMMPVNDGYWVLENIRNNPSLMVTPFIFLTAKVDRDDLRKGMELGADDYITKPFKISELLKAINVRLEKSEAYKTIFTSTENLTVKIDKDNFVLLDIGKSIERVKINSIECIIADNVFTNLYLTDGKMIKIRKSLTEWEELLPETIFVRIHRAVIINLDFVKQIEKWFNQTMIVHMQFYKEPLTISRSYTTKLKGRLFI